MPSQIVMPRLGWTMEVGTVVEWLKANGDLVEAGDHIFAVESDKAITEVESLDTGVLYIPENTPIGVEVPVGQSLGFILAPGESPPVLSIGAAAPEPLDLGNRIVEDIAGSGSLMATASPNGNFIGAKPVSPRARRVAAELGVDLDAVLGSGKGGRVREQDVRAAAEATSRATREPRATPSVRKLAEEIGVDLRAVSSNRPSGRITRFDLTQSAAASVSLGEGTTAPISPTRRAIRERMSETARTVAPVTLTTEADATELWELRERIKRELQITDSGLRAPSITDLLVRISALALLDQPEMNVWMDGDTMTQFHAAHIGIAVDTRRGLLVPVLRNADQKSIHDIAAESAALIEKTRDGTIGGDQLKGSTFTISNLGMFEIDAFTPILHLPEAAILGIGRIVPKPVVIGIEDETIAVRRMMHLSLTFDHRVVDGAPAARFLQRIKGMIERPSVSLTR